MARSKLYSVKMVEELEKVRVRANVPPPHISTRN